MIDPASFFWGVIGGCAICGIAALAASAWITRDHSHCPPAANRIIGGE